MTQREVSDLLEKPAQREVEGGPCDGCGYRDDYREDGTNPILREALERIAAFGGVGSSTPITIARDALLRTGMGKGEERQEGAQPQFDCYGDLERPNVPIPITKGGES